MSQKRYGRKGISLKGGRNPQVKRCGIGLKRNEHPQNVFWQGGPNGGKVKDSSSSCFCIFVVAICLSMFFSLYICLHVLFKHVVFAWFLHFFLFTFLLIAIL